MRRGKFRMWKGWRPLLNPCRGGELVFRSNALSDELEHGCSVCGRVLASHSAQMLAAADAQLLTFRVHVHAAAREHFR